MLSLQLLKFQGPLVLCGNAGLGWKIFNKNEWLNLTLGRTGFWWPRFPTASQNSTLLRRVDSQESHLRALRFEVSLDAPPTECLHQREPGLPNILRSRNRQGARIRPHCLSEEAAKMSDHLLCLTSVSGERQEAASGFLLPKITKSQFHDLIWKRTLIVILTNPSVLSWW